MKKNTLNKRKSVGRKKKTARYSVSENAQKKSKGGKTKVVDDLIIDISNFSSSTQLLEKRKELLDVQKELEDTREEVKKTLGKITESEQDLSKKRKELTNNIIALDKFIVENERRKNKAIENKKKEEQELRKCVNQIERTKNQINDLNRELADKRREQRERYNKYYDYLHSVVGQRFGHAQAINPEDVKQIMKKHVQLERTHKQLNEFVIKKEKEVNEELKKLKKYVEKAKNDNVNQDNKLALLTKELETVLLKSSTLRKDNDNYMTKLSKTKVTEGQIQMACNYLYNRVSKFYPNTLNMNIKMGNLDKTKYDQHDEKGKHIRTIKMLTTIRWHVRSFYEICQLIDEKKRKAEEIKNT